MVCGSFPIYHLKPVHIEKMDLIQVRICAVQPISKCEFRVEKKRETNLSALLVIALAYSKVTLCWKEPQYDRGSIWHAFDDNTRARVLFSGKSII